MKKLFLLFFVSSLVSIDHNDKTKLDEFARFAYSTHATVYNSFDLALDCIKNNIPGDFVECGVAAGTQVAAMAHASQKYNAHKVLHLFDSFEGIPLAGPQDDQQPGIGAITHNVHVKNLNELLVTSGITVWSLEQVKSIMNSWGIDSRYLRYHKGWFQHTLPLAADRIKSVSLLRLDGDLYESTKVCLEYLYPKISKGGYIIIDDYALTGCRKAVDEYLEEHNIHPTIITIKDGMGPVYWQIQ